MGKDPYEPEKIGNVIAQMIARYGLGETRARKQLAQAWSEVAGSDFAEMTQVLGMRAKKLEIKVLHSALLQELTFRQKDLLADLKQKLPELELKGLKFKAG